MRKALLFVLLPLWLLAGALPAVSAAGHAGKAKAGKHQQDEPTLAKVVAAPTSVVELQAPDFTALLPLAPAFLAFEAPSNQYLVPLKAGGIYTEPLGRRCLETHLATRAP